MPAKTRGDAHTQPNGKGPALCARRCKCQPNRREKTRPSQPQPRKNKSPELALRTFMFLTAASFIQLLAISLSRIAVMVAISSQRFSPRLRASVVDVSFLVAALSRCVPLRKSAAKGFSLPLYHSFCCTAGSAAISCAHSGPSLSARFTKSLTGYLRICRASYGLSRSATWAGSVMPGSSHWS